MTCPIFLVCHVLSWHKRYVQNYVFAFCACGWSLVLSTKLLAGKLCFHVFMCFENKPVDKSSCLWQIMWGGMFVWVVYKMGIVRHSAREPTTQPTTHNPQPLTHNSQHQDELPSPYPLAALPAISMAIAATAPALGSAAPYGPTQGTCG